MGYGIFPVIETSPNICQYPIPIDPFHHCIKIQLQLSYWFSNWIFNTINVYRDGGWEKIPKGTLRLRLRTRLPSPASWLLAGIWCRQPGWMSYPRWNLISLGHNSCISYMHVRGYNTCNLHDETDASVYLIDWILLVQQPSTDHDSYRHTRSMTYLYCTAVPTVLLVYIQ